ncbi:MAG: hypothetical protein LBS09_06865 [Bacteroidales bacterium]|nr:hypothetical protein [Bacteroidales bacterium]
MKRAFLFFALSYCCVTAWTQQNLSELMAEIAKTHDTIFIRNDTLSVDAVTCDSAIRAKFGKDSYYAYRKSRLPFSQRLQLLINKWLWKFFNTTLSKNTWQTIYISLGIIAILSITSIVLMKRTRIFYRGNRKKPAYRIEDEDIENQDYDILLAQSLNSGQYAEAVRWQFLKTLQKLQKYQLISFDSYKTVNEYAYEITETELRNIFKTLSYNFIYYRYGQGEADRTAFGKFRDISEEIIKMAGK